MNKPRLLRTSGFYTRSGEDLLLTANYYRSDIGFVTVGETAEQKLVRDLQVTFHDIDLGPYVKKRGPQSYPHGSFPQDYDNLLQHALYEAGVDLPPEHSPEWYQYAGRQAFSGRGDEPPQRLSPNQA